MLELSQVILGVRDLDVATRKLERVGLTVIDGGRHPGVGTANRIVPLGREYLELLAVVDPELAATNEYGRSLLDRTRDGDRLVRWSLRTDDINEPAQRLGLEVESRSRLRPDGVRISWRAAGLEPALRDPWLPFFMHWDDPAAYPGHTPVVHSAGVTGVAWLELTPGDDRFTTWVAAADAPIRLLPGRPAGLWRVALSTPTGELLVDPLTMGR